MRLHDKDGRHGGFRGAMREAPNKATSRSSIEAADAIPCLDFKLHPSGRGFSVLPGTPPALGARWLLTQRPRRFEPRAFSLDRLAGRPGCRRPLLGTNGAETGIDDHDPFVFSVTPEQA
jgi:hypothetical protein